MNAVPTPSPSTGPNLIGITGIARRLVADGALAEQAARKAMADATAAKMPLAQWLGEKRLVTPALMAAANSAEFGIPLIDASVFDANYNAMKLVPSDLLEKHSVLPLFKRGNRLFVGISDPTHTRALDDLRFATNMMVEPILVADDQIKRTLELWSSTSAALNVGSDDEDLDGVDVGSTEADADDEGITGEEGPVVKFVNKILVGADQRKASDIHFEPYEGEYRVRYRMDGMLKVVATAPVKMAGRIAARLKVMAQLDIAEKRKPQDGRIKLVVSRNKVIDFRISFLPTLVGEKIVLRILDGSAAKLNIDALGFEEDQKVLYLKALQNPYGMILVTGPTGSGKTVSLYTGLNILNTEDRNISTAEDPVEIRLRGINQVQISSRGGMTFADALRSFLRQDPDIIMVGEIRDYETAEIAIKAAQTGHMVISTLHTNDAPKTIARLMKMGVKPFDITSSVMLIMAQRLGRRLCKCKLPANHSRDRLLSAGFTPAQMDDIASGRAVIYAPNPEGCEENCNGGYKGRVGIYQVMPMTELIQEIILQEGNDLQIEEACQHSGVRNLRQSALRRVLDGTTSLEEADRVTIT